MSIKIKTTIVANERTGVSGKTPIVTRVQTNNGYEFVNSLAEVRELLETGNYSIFVNYIRGKDNNAPFKKGILCVSYKEAIEYVASHAEDGGFRVDLVIRNREYSREELAAVAANLDF